MEEFRKYIRDEVVVEKIIDPIVETRSKDEIIKDLMIDSQIDLTQEYKTPPTYLGVIDDFGGITPICTPANISVITGRAKSKKSFVQNLFASSSVKNGLIQSKLVSYLPEDKTGVLLFDTEQSLYHTYRRTYKIGKLIGYNPDNLGVFSMRGLEPQQMMDLMQYALDYYPNVGMVYVDQIADMVSSINDEEQAVKILRWLEKISKDRDLHISCVLHQNKGNNLASGWIGTQALKKAETVITVDIEEQNRDISHVAPSHSRSKNFEQFSIMINSQGLPEVLNKDSLNSFINQPEL